jgi:aspartate-semialdehyde dehydrogenase
MRQVLAERKFPIRSIKFLASPKSVGAEIDFAGRTYHVEPIRPEAFVGVRLVLASTPAAVSKEFVPAAVRAGAIVIDNSSAWRMDPDCPLVVPEINGDRLHAARNGIVANPNCTAIPLCVALKPLQDLAKIRRVVVSTYQSSSGRGDRGLADFGEQLKAWMTGSPMPTPKAHRAQLAGNVVTLDWALEPNGYSEEENKVINETKKILNDDKIAVSSTCVRVPVRVAHSISVNVESDRPISVVEARAALASAPGLVLLDEGEAPQPIQAEGSDMVFVGRVRRDPGRANALNLWVVADNLRKGAATNAVQCAEELVRRGIVA